MATHPDAPQPLPGLEDLGEVEARRGRVGEVERGVRRTLAELRRLSKITEVDAGRSAIAISLARMMATKEATGRGSTFSNDARLLVELLDALAGEASRGEAEFEGVLHDKMAEWEAIMRDEAAKLADARGEA